MLFIIFIFSNRCPWSLTICPFNPVPSATLQTTSLNISALSPHIAFIVTDSITSFHQSPTWSTTRLSILSWSQTVWSNHLTMYKTSNHSLLLAWLRYVSRRAHSVACLVFCLLGSHQLGLLQLQLVFLWTTTRQISQNAVKFLGKLEVSDQTLCQISSEPQALHQNISLYGTKMVESVLCCIQTLTS